MRNSNTAVKNAIIESDLNLIKGQKSQTPVQYIKQHFVLFLFTAVLLLTLLQYLNLQEKLRIAQLNITSCEQELAALTQDNDDMNRRLTTVEDLSGIRDVAVNKLGMVYAASSQLQSYSVNEYDYVHQTKALN